MSAQSSKIYKYNNIYISLYLSPHTPLYLYFSVCLSLYSLSHTLSISVSARDTTVYIDKQLKLSITSTIFTPVFLSLSPLSFLTERPRTNLTHTPFFSLLIHEIFTSLYAPTTHIHHTEHTPTYTHPHARPYVASSHLWVVYTAHCHAHIQNAWAMRLLTVKWLMT